MQANSPEIPSRQAQSWYVRVKAPIGDLVVGPLPEHRVILMLHDCEQRGWIARAEKIERFSDKWRARN